MNLLYSSITITAVENVYEQILCMCIAYHMKLNNR